MKQLLTTTGRVSRSTFWNFFVGVFVLFAILGAVLENAAIPEWA
jgi:uncharacterized membrane protein YhaH (DUF805 family)